MSHETANHITGLFYNFTFVKMKGPNKIIFETKLKNSLINFESNRAKKHGFIHGKAMVPYVQLSTSCRIGF